MTTEVELDSAVIARVTDQERQTIGLVAIDHGMEVSEFVRFATLEYVAAFQGGKPWGGDE